MQNINKRTIKNLELYKELDKETLMLRFFMLDNYNLKFKNEIDSFTWNKLRDLIFKHELRF